jgi:hypothetical protein
MNKIISILILSVFLFSCESTQEREERERAEFLNVHTSTDKFRKLEFYSGHRVIDRESFSIGFLKHSYQIDAVTRDKSTTTYRIYLHNRFKGSWPSHDTAFDSNGNKLNVLDYENKSAGCTKFGCVYTTDIILGVSRKYLKDNSSGITIKLFESNSLSTSFNDKANSILFNIPGAYIENFLSKTKSIVKID